ncbi:MAG: 1,4-dihydroxy-2-naphthoyl-CoA hydrolase [Chloroflexota bacterium]|nr:1,4-dihydroxy-2-naphthoyl-CoA hydrolase [Chloroflexota bacterium]
MAAATAAPVTAAASLGSFGTADKLAHVGQDFAEMLNAGRGPFEGGLGLVITSATTERVEGIVDLDPARHTQPWGIIHGGVYCTIIESLASIGAAINVMPEKTSAGIENQTSFLRSVSGGRVTGVATPVQRGRQMHLWQVEVRDDRDRILAHGRVRLVIRDIQPAT